MSSSPARAFLPAFLVLMAAAGLIALIVLVSRDPVVEQVSPRTIRARGQVELRGRFFGDEIESIYLAGRRVPVSSVLAWEEERIVFTAAADARSGLLVVENDRGRSEGVLVQVQGGVSRADQGVRGRPVITALDADELVVGTLLTISGTNFGSVQRTSTVRFVSDDGVCTSCADRLFFGTWTNDEIQIRVPAGITDGAIEVMTPDGTSNPFAYSVVYPAGRVGRQGRAEIGLLYELSLQEATLTESQGGVASRRLSVRLPTPAESPLQTSVRFVDGRQSSFMFEGISDGFTRTVSRTVLVERHGATTRLIPGDTRGAEQVTAFTSFYTRDLPGLDLAREQVRSAAAGIATRGRSAAQIAEAVYDFTRRTLTPVLGQAASAAEAVESGFADHSGYSHVMVAILRSLGVPSRVVTGVYSPTARLAYVHSWVEYFTPAVGWVPADPYFGDGAYAGTREPIEDPAVFYLGNLDPLRVAFTRGYDDYDPKVPSGLSLRPAEPFSQQAFFARAGSAVESVAFSLPPPRAIGLFLLD
mgnify:CR=1 FL=1